MGSENLTKCCSKCKQSKPVTEFNKRGDSDRLRSKCKQCVSLVEDIKNPARVERRALMEDRKLRGVRYCPRCKDERPTSDFRYWGYCYRCVSAIYKADRKANPAKYRERDAKSRAKIPPEKLREYSREYRKRNIDKVREYAKNTYYKDPQKAKDRHYAWTVKKREHLLEYRRKRSADLVDAEVLRRLRIPKAPQELIEAKRLQLQIVRYIKERTK